MQQEAMKLLLRQAETKRSRGGPKYFDACLQLALCHHVGFGVEPSLSLMFRYLARSLEGSRVAKEIYRRVALALRSENCDDVDINYCTELDHRLEAHMTQVNYFSNRVRLHQPSLKPTYVPRARTKMDTSCIQLPELMALYGERGLSTALKDNHYTDEEISVALAFACKQGMARAAVELCAHCRKFVQDPEAPTPLHWLIMFDAQEVQEVGTALVRGSESEGPCSDLLDSIPPDGDGILFLPDHCLELLGTPLHWAVRARHLDLVVLLCHLGANVNARWVPTLWDRRFSQQSTLPSLRPLDLAIQFHLPEMVQALVGLGAQWLDLSLAKPMPALHSIGQACTPFSRYIIHGEAYRDALEQTLAVIISHGNDINETDAAGETALTVALSVWNCETYIIEGLVNAGARTDLLTSGSVSNVAFVLSQSGVHQRYNDGTLASLVDRIPSINALDDYGRNALHYSVIVGNRAMASILCDHGSIDIESRSAHADTALHFAATFGHVDILALLIQKGASIEAPDGSGNSALRLAVLHRKMDAADILLHASAEYIFFSRPAYAYEDNILHVASASNFSQDTIVSGLLMTHPKLRSTSVINGMSSKGETPLHKAAYYGDYDAVHALLEFGADYTRTDRGKETPHDVTLKLFKLANSQHADCTHPRMARQPLDVRRKFLAALEEIVRMFQMYEENGFKMDSAKD